MAANELAARMNALLVEIEDGRKGFAVAAEECELPELKPLLQECADDCTRSLHDLQGSAKTVHQGQVQHASAGAALREGWTRLRSLAPGDQTLAILGEVEREHGRIEEAFAAVLAVEPPPAIRKVLEKESARIGRNRNRLEEVRRRYAAAS
jgi:uncharacterized protein (TIGR02284 family)